MKKDRMYQTQVPEDKIADNWDDNRKYENRQNVSTLYFQRGIFWCYEKIGYRARKGNIDRVEQIGDKGEEFPH
jgi:hypothetical protein